MNLKYLLLYSIIFLFIFSCKEQIKKDIAYYEIYEYDNIISNENKSINYIDSMLKIYPQSDYFYGIRIMLLAVGGLPDSALNYNNKIYAKEHISGTFMRMGVAMTFMMEYFNNGLTGEDHSFLESIDYDEKKVNIWARLGAFLVNFLNKQYSKAEQYLLEAYQINNENSFVLETLTRFYISRHNYLKAKTYYDDINPKYDINGLKSLGHELDSLLKLPKVNIDVDSVQQDENKDIRKELESMFKNKFGD